MSERMTRVSARDRSAPGYMTYGRKTRAEMIAGFREHYERQCKEAQDALALPDEALIVETFLGPWAMKNREEVAE